MEDLTMLVEQFDFEFWFIAAYTVLRKVSAIIDFGIESGKLFFRVRIFINKSKSNMPDDPGQ